MPLLLNLKTQVIQVTKARDPLLTHIKNMPGHDLRVIFSILEEIENNIIYEYAEEESIFETFLGHFWKATEGEDMLDAGRGMKTA